LTQSYVAYMGFRIQEALSQDSQATAAKLRKIQL